MVLFAHIRSASALSNSTYGCPRPMGEWQDDGLAIAAPTARCRCKARPGATLMGR